MLDALRTRLMAPELYEAFVRGFTAEWNREQGARATDDDRRRDEMKRLDRKIEKLVDAIGESGGSVAIYKGFKDAEVRKAEIEAELAVAEAPAPRLMPNLAELYRAKVAALQEVLSDEDAGAAREQIRALIDEVRLTPIPRRSESATRDRGAWAACCDAGFGIGIERSGRVGFGFASQVGCGGRI